MRERVKINNLRNIATEYSTKAMPEEKIMKNDLTEMFFYELEMMIKNRELINIQIVGEVASSKSTTALKLVKWINKELGKEMKMIFICSDQMMFMRRTIEDREQNVCYEIDEWNTLGETGSSSSIETAFFSYYSDVHAQEFVHRVSCSPDRIVDKNANIILEVIGKDTKRKITRLKLKYRVMCDSGYIVQPIGYVDIDVSDVIDEEWYRKYRERKFFKMKMVAEKGIRDIREIEYAEMELMCLEELEKRAEMGITIDKGTIAAKMNMIKRKQKRFLSIIGSEEIIRIILGMLTVNIDLGRVRRKIKALKSAQAKKDSNELKEEIKEYEEMATELEEAKKENKKELNDMIEIKKELEKV